MKFKGQCGVVSECRNTVGEMTALKEQGVNKTMEASIYVEGWPKTYCSVSRDQGCPEFK